MQDDDSQTVPVDAQLSQVSDAIQRAAADLLAARDALDRERAAFTARGGRPSRELLLAATHLVNEMRRTDQALTGLLKELEARTPS